MKNFFTGFKDWVYHSIAKHPIYTVIFGVACFLGGIMFAGFTG